MIKRIALQNFQSHLKSVLNMHPGINIIQGASDGGKSAIRRALELVTYNRPNGTGYILTGKEQCRVQVQTTDGVVLREKGKGKNTYRINKEKPIKPGTDVPPEVKEILRLDTTNIQDQKDLYFLLNLSPGKVAKKLNEVVGLDEMDRALKDINSRARKVKAEQVFVKEEMDAAEASVKALEWTIQADEKLKYIQVLIEAKGELQARMDRLKQVLINVQYQENVLAGIKLFPEKMLTDLKDMFTLRQSLAKRKINISSQLKFILKIERDLKPPKPVDFEGLKESITLYDKLDVQWEDLEEVICDIQAGDRELGMLQIEIDETHSALAALKYSVDICPFCDQTM